MNEIELKVGHTYSAKRPKAVGLFNPMIDDRQIIWLCPMGFHVQYDSPTVRPGRKYPKVERDKFLRWVGSDVTSQMKDGEWRSARRTSEGEGNGR